LRKAAARCERSGVNHGGENGESRQAACLETDRRFAGNQRFETHPLLLSVEPRQRNPLYIRRERRGAAARRFGRLAQASERRQQQGDR